MSSAGVIRAAAGPAIAYALGVAVPLSIAIAVPVRLETGWGRYSVTV